MLGGWGAVGLLILKIYLHRGHSDPKPSLEFVDVMNAIKGCLGHNLRKKGF